MRRRDLLVGSGALATLALTGQASSVAADLAAAESSSDLESLLEPLPTTEETDFDYLQFIRTTVEDVDEEDDLAHEPRGLIEELDDVDVDDVTHALTAISEGYRSQLGVVIGSFDRPEPGQETDEVGDVRIGETDDVAFVTEEGRATLVGTPEGNAGDVAAIIAEVLEGDDESFLEDGEEIVTVLSLLESKTYAHATHPEDHNYYRDYFDLEDDGVSTIGAGYDVVPTGLRGEDEIDVEYAFVLESGADLDDEEIEDILADVEDGTVLETDLERDGDVVHVEAVVEQPPERDRQAAPDARIDVAVDADAADGTVTFEHVSGESVDAGELELWVDGERYDEQPADVFETIDEGDSYAVDTDPVASVLLRWIDEEESVYDDVADVLVGEDSFEADYDVDEEALELTYVGERDVDIRKLDLRHHTEEGPTSPEGEYDGSETITTGDTATVEEVAIGDRVALELDVSPAPNHHVRPLVQFHARPPRMFVSGRGKDQVSVRYRDEAGHDADGFTVLVDDEPADVQFDDEYETLSEGDELELEDLEHGAEVVVEWTEPDETAVVAEHVVSPRTYLEVTYDDTDGVARIEHVDGEAVDADDLEARVDDDAVDDVFSGETFEPGEEVSVEAEPFVSVEAYWTGHDERERPLGREVTASEALEVAYDPDESTVDLVYTGTQEADPERLEVTRHGEGGRPSDGRALFAEEYDTLTEGDGVVLEDVATTERVRVSVVYEGENYSSRRSILSFRPEPRWAFRFQEDDGDVVATYTGEVARDGEEFEVRIDDELADVQPGDDHDTLESGDEIDLGSLEVGSRVTVEWVVPDEPVEVDDHVIVPEAEFDFEFDEGDGEVTIEHAGGDDFDADDLGVIVEPSALEPMSWDGGGTVSEGDSTTVDVEEDDIGVVIVYREDEALTHKHLER